MPRSEYSCCGRLSPIIMTCRVKKCNDILNNWYRGKQAHIIIKEHSPKAWDSTCRSSCEATIRAVQTPILSVQLAALSPRIRSFTEVSETVAASGAFSSWRLLLSWIRSEAGLSWQPSRELGVYVCEWMRRSQEPLWGRSIGAQNLLFKTFLKTAPYREGVTSGSCWLLPIPRGSRTNSAAHQVPPNPLLDLCVGHLKSCFNPRQRDYF